jgi:hypothetical protein
VEIFSRSSIINWYIEKSSYFVVWWNWFHTVSLTIILHLQTERYGNKWIRRKFVQYFVHFPSFTYTMWSNECTIVLSYTSIKTLSDQHVHVIKRRLYQSIDDRRDKKKSAVFSSISYYSYVYLKVKQLFIKF